MPGYQESPRTYSPLVSVIINCFNGEAFVAEAIESVLRQTYQNFEIIFWDNISTDGTKDIVGSFKDQRIKYFLAERHTFLYEARNYALEKASGELIAFLDADDWWQPEKIEKQVGLFKNPEVGLAYSNYWVVNKNGERLHLACKHALPSGYITDSLLKEYVVGLLTIMVRRKALEDLSYVFDNRFHIIGDYDFVIRLSTLWFFAVDPEPLAYSRWHGENESGKIAGRIRQSQEYDLWINSIAKAEKAISESVYYGHIATRNEFEKGMMCAMTGKRIHAIAISHNLPFGKRKLKLWAAAVLPQRLLNMFRV